jgi:hypothetical protein
MRCRRRARNDLARRGIVSSACPRVLGVPGGERNREAQSLIAIIGADPESEGTYLQDYFDLRGVVRLYKMSFEDGVWKLRRDEPDFSPLDFSQRFTGIFSDDGKSIAGRWEISHGGKSWEHDFDLTYIKAE